MSNQTVADFHPIGQTGGIAHLLAPASINCPNCNTPPSEHEVRDHDPAMHDGNVHCKCCGTFVRYYDAG